MATRATQRKPKKPKLVVALDGDKLGSAAGAAVATTVMVLCFFYQRMDFGATAIRAGWAFVVTYAAIFFLARVILRTAIYEFVIMTREKKAKRRRRDSDPKETTAETAGAA